MQDIFGDPYVKQVRSYYLFKSLQNVLAFTSVNQSITVATKVLQSIMTDQSDMGMYQRLDEENKGENEHVSATPPVQAL